MTTNKPEVQRYDDMGCPEQICRVDTMHESDDGDYVLYEDYEALKAECEKLREHLQNMIDQTTPLEPVPGDPKWSRRIQLDAVIEERDSLRVECEKLRKDAERYRWLRADNGYFPEESCIRGGQELDAAIDDAMEEQQP